MKNLIALSLLFAFGAEAGTLKKIFKNDAAPAAQKYLAVFSIPGNNHDEYAVLFGQGTQYKVFNTDVVTYANTPFTVSSVDEQVKLTQQGIELNKSVKVTVSDMRNTKLAEGTYSIYSSPAAVNYAMNIDKVVEAEFNKYRTMDNPATTTELRRMLKQVELDVSYEEPKEFPTFDLQIEWSLGYEAANAQRASSIVSTSGQDMISREILQKGSKWFKNIDDAVYALEEKIDNEVDTENMTFATFSTKVQYEGLSARLQKAISKHLKVEIQTADGWDCQGSTYTWISAKWILKDGSSLSYHPGTECD